MVKKGMHDEHQQKESQANGCFLFDRVFPSLKLGSMQQTRISILDGSMVPAGISSHVLAAFEALLTAPNCR